MNCVPGFVNILWLFCMWVGSGGLLYFLKKIDKELGACDQGKIKMLRISFCLLFGIKGIYGSTASLGADTVSYLLLAVYLIVCSVQDAMTCMVSDFLQYIGLLGGSILLLSRMPEAQIGISLILFVLIQRLIFMKMYGHADGMAFLICALYLGAEGKDIEAYLLHMGAAFLLLAVVQFGKRNVSVKGKLKTPAALLPYIAVSFLLII